MLCQQCKQRPAKVQITQTINGKKNVIFLCEDCAELGEELIMAPFNMPDLLSSILENFSGITQPQIKEKAIICQSCGTTYDEFIHTGKFGCSECYEAFGTKLIPIFRRIHGNIKHTGKKPEVFKDLRKAEKEIDNLKLLLEQAIKDEKYEDAAILRDKIKGLINT